MPGCEISRGLLGINFGLQLLLLYMRQERISKTETVCLGGNMLLLLVGQLLLGRNTWLVVLDHRAL